MTATSHRLGLTDLAFRVVVTTVLHASATLLLISLFSGPASAQIRIGVFSTDVTCPIGHPLLAGLRQPAKEIVDPLYVHGAVLKPLGEPPIVLCAVDWCEIRNGSYDAWRRNLARAAKTTENRVLLCCLHQHDAPVTDVDAERLLSSVGLGGKMFDVQFERKCIARVAAAVKQACGKLKTATHIGIGKAKVERIASNRRVVLADSRVTYARGSNSGGNPIYRNAPEGEIDPWLRTLSFWQGDRALAALHVYATHPMSYYGRGGVSADFVGMARKRMQQTDTKTFHFYATGCAGDVTAGKYNDGSPGNRPVLAERLFAAMRQSWRSTRRFPMKKLTFRSVALRLPYRKGGTHTRQSLEQTLKNRNLPLRSRILAAMGLSSRKRVEAGRPIDFTCLDFGKAQVLLFPGEAFVGYQLMAQKICPDSFVICLGYGECWPGYIPTSRGFADGFRDMWLWVAPGADRAIHHALQRVLNPH